MDRRKRNAKQALKDSDFEEESKKPTLRARARNKKVNYILDESSSDSSEVISEKPAKRGKKEKRNQKATKKTKPTQKKQKGRKKQDSDSDFEMDGRFEEDIAADEEMSDLSSSDSIESEVVSEASSVIKSNNGKRKVGRGNKNSAKQSNKTSSTVNVIRTMHTKNFIPSTVRVEADTTIKAAAGTSVNDMGGLEEAANLEIPKFIKREYIRDKNLLRPDDPNYDPSSVHIPEEEFDKLTPLMKQYWGIKSKYYDSIVFVRMCHWYTVFYYDIIALNLLSNTHLKISE